jgi:acyl-CoA thioesterase-1
MRHLEVERRFSRAGRYTIIDRFLLSQGIEGMRHGTRSGRIVVSLLGLIVASSLWAPACKRQSAPPAAPPPREADGSVAPVKVVALGDSLTAGYGLSAEQAYPALLDARLQAAGLPATVVNAGVSGDTSAGGLRRVDWALDDGARVMIVALGGNDALRGLPVDDLERNLAAIIERARAKGVVVVLAGMEAPPNLGPLYTASFRRVYRDLAKRYDVVLVPFLLEGIAGMPGLNQADGIHPNAEGAVKVADNLWPAVERAVRAVVTP